MQTGNRRRSVLIALSVALLLATSSPADAGLGEKGRTYPGDDDLDFQPIDVAVGSDGFIYGLDYDDHNIDVFAPSEDADNYVYRTSFAASGYTEGNLFYPQAIAAAEGSIYVADTANSRVSQFSNDGGHIRSWGENGGTVDGQFLEASSIATDVMGNVYVGDGRRNDIQKFTGSGSFVMGFKAETPDGPLVKVSGVAIAPDGSIYVSDEAGDRVVRYDVAGGFQSELEGGDLRNPVDVAVDPKGIVYVVCSHEDNQTVQVFDASGTFKVAFGKGLWSFPKGVGIDPKSGDLWVADTSGQRLWSYGEVKTSVRIRPESGRQLEEKKLFYSVSDLNQLRPCHVEAEGTITIPLADDPTSRIEGSFNIAKGSPHDLEERRTVPLSGEQAREARLTLREGKRITVKISFHVICPDSETMTKSLKYTIRKST